MVIFQNGETLGKTMNLTDSKYILVKNHVRELVSGPLEDSANICSSQKPKNTSDKVIKKRKKSSENEHVSDSNISSEDLEEIKIVYYKCKEVLSKIELKYGNLLKLGYDESSCKKRKYSSDNNKCTCSFNTKIMFDDEGKQIIKNPVSDIHICHKNIAHFNDHNQPFDRNVTISYEGQYDTPELPDNKLELRDMLKKPDISETFRNHVIEKFKCIRNQDLDIIRCGKKELIEKVKSNPNDIFCFKGANLSTLQGYPVPDLQ